MRKKRLIPLILASAACFITAFAFLNAGKTEKTAVVAQEQTVDLSLSSFQMYHGAQIRLPLNSQGKTKKELGNTMRFMGVVAQKQYEDIEKTYGEYSGNDTTEWGVVFAQRPKMEDANGNIVRPLDEATVFGYKENPNGINTENDKSLRKYYWMKDKENDWATDNVGGVATKETTEPNYIQGGKSTFTPVRYDNLETLSYKYTNTLINQNVSIDGTAGAAYYVISAFVSVPKGSETTEIVARAYVRYIDHKGTDDTSDDEVVYKFADYAGNDMENNSRSLTYVAQKYMESDENKAAEDKVYVDYQVDKNGVTHDNTVEEYINLNAKTGYSIEYHFMDADGKSIVPPPVTVEEKDSNYTVSQLIEMSSYEIIDMSLSSDLKSVAEQYGAQIDWYNPSRVTVAKAYANGKTVFKLYYANEDYANVVDDYDVLCDYDINDRFAVSWHYETDIMGGTTNAGFIQYDKAYTLGDETYRPTFCAEHDFDDCEHVCENVKCSSPNHGHASHKITTKLYNNTLLLSATLPGGEMVLDGNGKWVSGLNFADYEYVLFRFYSSGGGMTMSLIAGATTIETPNGKVDMPVTTGVNYTIKQGWNRIKVDGKMLQETIEAYAKAGGLMNDDLQNEKLAVYAPYRNGQYIQFLVDDDPVYGTDSWPMEQAYDWELYFDDTIGVKEVSTKKPLSYAGFEDFLTDAEVEELVKSGLTIEEVQEQYLTKEDIIVESLDVSINTDLKYVHSGKKSLKLVDTRDKTQVGGWTSVRLKLEKNGEPITLAELSQMEVSFQLYCSCETIVWFGGCVWTDAKPLKTNQWNTIRMSGWRMVDAILNIAKDHVAYDETTGMMIIYFAELAHGVGATLYVDDITATYVNSHNNVIEMDDFTMLPTRTELLSAPKFITNMYAINGDNSTIDDPADVENVPYWFAIDEEVNNKSNANLVYSYEVKKNNQLSTYIEFGIENGRQRYREVSLGNMLDFYAVRAVETEKDAQGNVVNTRYSDWTYYEWDEAKEGSLWNNYVVLYDSNHADTEFATPVVTLLENGVVYWTTVAGADNGYACYINGVRAYDTHRTQAFLNHGDSFSVRVITTNAKMASAHTKPVVYKGERVGEVIKKEQYYYHDAGQYVDQAGNRYDILTVESGKTVYDVAAAQSEVFKEISRIPSTASSGGYAWKLTLGAKRYGVFLLPLTIGGQPLTNQQLLAADYVDLLVYAGANNKAGAYLSFNGTVPPANECTLISGQWNTIRIPTQAIYEAIQSYKHDENARAIIETAPYSNGVSPYDGKPLSRLCGYALFQISDAQENDYWIIDKASLVYDTDDYRSNNASFWFTQQDYGTLPIAAYNSLPPHSNYFDDAIADLQDKINKATTDEDKKYYTDSLANIQNMANALKKYDTLNYDSLLDFYVECGVNTMMGLYDYANYSYPGYEFVTTMLKECAERDMSYLLAWMGGTTFTEELLESQDAQLMRDWLREYATYAAFAGIMLTDEPGAVAYDNIVEAREAFEKYWGEDALYHVNLLPNWAGVDAWLNFKNPDTVSWWEGGYTYEKYVQEYIRTYSPQVLSFDVYPIVGNTNSYSSTLLNACDLSKSDHISPDNSSITVSNAVATEGASSLLIALENDRWVNLGTGGLTLAQFMEYEYLLMDVYNGGADATIRFHSGDELTIKNGWGTYIIPNDINAGIRDENLVQTNNSGFIYFENKTGSKIYLNVDNIRGIKATGSQRLLRKGYYQNLATIRHEALKANIPFWTYIQTTTWYEGGVLPTENELRWNVNTSLAYGAKGIQYFTGVVPYDSGGESFAGGLFNAQGERTDVYYFAQRANMYIQSVDHVLMNARSLGVVYAGGIPQFATIHSNSNYTLLTAAENAAEIPTLGTLTATQAGLKAVETITGNALVGCFDYNGKMAYYVVNNSTTGIAHINLVWDQSPNGHSTTVYGLQDSVGWISHVAEEDNLNSPSQNTTALASTVKGAKMTSDNWDRICLRNMMPGEAVLIVVD